MAVFARTDRLLTSLLAASVLLGLPGCELPEGDVDLPGSRPAPTPGPDPDPTPPPAGGGSDAGASPDPGPAPSPAGCSLTRPGGTGGEPGGVIPVCCTPAADDK